MRVRNKLILAVALITALCVLLTFSIGAIRTEVVNPTDYLISVNLKLYNNGSLVYDEDTSTGLNLYPASIVANSANQRFTINTYYSIRFPNDEDPNDFNHITYNSGTVDIFKFWGNGSLLEPGDSSVDADTEEFLSKDILISKISCWMVFGFYDTPSSVPLQPIPNEVFNSTQLYFGGAVLDSSMYSWSYTVMSTYSHRQDLNSGDYYTLRAFEITYTFDTPISPPTTNPYDYACISTLSFNSMEGWNGMRYLVGCDQVNVEYYNRNEYESGIINTNKQKIYDNKVKLDSINDSLNVSKPDDNVVSNLINDIKVGDVDYVVGLSKFDSGYPAYNTLITSILLGTLSIAFIGYALHGKR